MALTGRCLCGAVTYVADAEPLGMTYCHCDDCRRMTGSAYNVGVAVPPDSLRVNGTVKSYSVPNDGGRSREFCPECGSPLFTRYPDAAIIKAGTMDRCERLKPTAQIWTEMAVPWATIPDGLACFTRGRR